MKELAIAVEDRPGALADMGAALGRAGVSVEGGGAWIVHGAGVGHFLFEDATAARAALESAGIRVHDHANQLILVVDDIDRGRSVSEGWMRQWV